MQCHFALTNWSAESWPAATELHPRLSLFRDVLVSGREGLLKPDAAIYQRLLDRNGLLAGESIFIDDSLANVEGARAVGLDAIHFTDAGALRAGCASAACLADHLYRDFIIAV